MSSEQFNQVCAWLGTTLVPEPLYRASCDGWGSADFHAKCDNQGATLTVVKTTEGFIFGGYSNVPWTSASGNYKNSSQAFLFSLHCHAGLPPTKMPCTDPAHAVVHNASYGPVFGKGHDLCLEDSSNTASNTARQQSYQLPVGATANFLVGSAKFLASEVAVYRVA
jgi:hypothetical protein